MIEKWKAIPSTNKCNESRWHLSFSFFRSLTTQKEKNLLFKFEGPRAYRYAKIESGCVSVQGLYKQVNDHWRRRRTWSTGWGRQWFGRRRLRHTAVSLPLSASLWLSPAHSCSLWLSPAHSGSLWFSPAHSGSLWWFSPAHSSSLSLWVSLALPGYLLLCLLGMHVKHTYYSDSCSLCTFGCLESPHTLNFAYLFPAHMHWIVCVWAVSHLSGWHICTCMYNRGQGNPEDFLSHDIWLFGSRGQRVMLGFTK